MPESRPRRHRRVGVGLLVASAGLVLAGCGSAGAPGTTAPEGVDGLVVPTPSPDPADFVRDVDNPYLPLTPGATWTYEVTGGDAERTVVTTVADETREVAGVVATVVDERVTDERGRVVAERASWFAQDRDGNVWLLGEEATASGDGEPAGSWEAGVDGARAGLAMLARPRVGDGYRRGLREGVMEDRVEVLDLATPVVLDLDSYRALEVEESSTLEPGVVTHAYYAKGVGLVASEVVSGGAETTVLVAHDPG